jgi:hypothetical protein
MVDNPVLNDNIVQLQYITTEVTIIYSTASPPPSPPRRHKWMPPPSPPHRYKWMTPSSLPCHHQWLQWTALDPPLSTSCCQIRFQLITPHPNLQAHCAAASGSSALRPWTPSCRRDGAGETLAWGANQDGGSFGWRCGRAAGKTLATGWVGVVI